jgi:hypothetical protein
VWVAPAITSVAHAATTGSSRCSCTGVAYGLYGHFTDPSTLGPYPSVADGRCDPISLTTPLGIAFVGTACATLAGCSAKAEVTTLTITAAGLSVVSINLLEGTQTLDCCTPTVTASIANLTVNGTIITVGAPNFPVSVGLINVVVNEQIVTCDKTTGALTSEASVVHISSPTLFAGFDIWLGYTKLTSSGGACCH